MKPTISITDQQIHIDDDQYTLFIRFKQQPIRTMPELKPDDIQEIHLDKTQIVLQPEHPQEVIAIRSGDTSNSLHPSTKGNKCLHCGKPFVSKYKSKKCCSTQCSKNYSNFKLRQKTKKTDRTSSLKGVPAMTSDKKICLHCEKEFKPTSNAQLYCSVDCKVKGNVKPIKSPNRKTGAYDKKQLQEERKLKKLLSQSPNTDDLVPVIIDHKTTIWIKPGEDPEQARKNFIEKHNQFEKND